MGINIEGYPIDMDIRTFSKDCFDGATETKEAVLMKEKYLKRFHDLSHDFIEDCICNHIESISAAGFFFAWIWPEFVEATIDVCYSHLDRSKGQRVYRFTKLEERVSISETKANTKREKTDDTINDFLDRNKDYAVEVYLRSTEADTIISRLLVPSDRNYDRNGYDGNCFRLSWGENCCNDLTIPYDDVIGCYKETDEYGSQTIHVSMKYGLVIDFECSGMRV